MNRSIDFKTSELYICHGRSKPIKIELFYGYVQLRCIMYFLFRHDQVSPPQTGSVWLNSYGDSADLRVLEVKLMKRESLFRYDNGELCIPTRMAIL